MHTEQDRATYLRTLAVWGVKPHPIRTFIRTLLGA